MSADLLQFLSETTLAAGIGTLLVLALRLPMRRLLGARAAYALWLLVPVALVAVMLPSPRIETSVALVAPRGKAATTEASPVAAAAPRFDATPWLIHGWALGSIGFAATLVRRQRRFRRTLGALQPQADGSWRAQNALAGPAVIGAVRGRVVVPADFDERYTPLQRDLVLRHERVHVARFDLAANLLATLLRCLHWFNPLLHYAFGRFRFDQELAADAVVLAQRPEARRDYAEAMLCTQLLDRPPPLGCHWQPAHPLKERIMMLKQPLPGPARALLGAALVAALSLGAGVAAWAAQPARDAQVQLDEDLRALRVTLVIDGKAVMVNESEARRFEKQSVVQSSEGLGIDYVITALDDDAISLSGTITSGGKVVSRPSLQFRRGDAASLTVAAADSGLGVDASFDFLYGSAKELRATPRAELGSLPVVIEPTYARLSPPVYPESAKQEKVAGTVMLRVLVARDGSPARVEVDISAGDTRLDEAAVAKVKDWRFNPRTVAGNPVEQWVQVPVTFSLDGPPADDEAVPAAANRLDEIYIAPKA